MGDPKEGGLAPGRFLLGLLITTVVSLSLVKWISASYFSTIGHYVFGNAVALFLYAGMSVLVKKAQKAQKAKNKEMGQVTHRKFDAETLAANEKMFSRHLQYLHLHSEYLINKEKFDSKRIAVSNEPAATPSTPSEKKSAQQAAKFVHTGISHIFAKKHFDRPTWCSFCGRFLWGIGKQGYGCKASGCSYAAHSECVRVLQMGSPSYFTCNRSAK